MLKAGSSWTVNVKLWIALDPTVFDAVNWSVKTPPTVGVPASRPALESVSPGESVASIRAHTGFDFDAADDVPVTPDPTEAELALLRGPVCDEMLETYPEFCARVFKRKLAA